MLIENKQKERKTYMYQNYVCPRCFNQLTECSCEIFPPYSLLMVDMGMQEIIRILNEKNYITNGTCESHYGSMSIDIYVSFIRNYNLPAPDGFKWKKNKTTIAHTYSSKISEDDFIKEKEKYIAVLLDWAKSLPNN